MDGSYQLRLLYGSGTVWPEYAVDVPLNQTVVSVPSLPGVHESEPKVATLCMEVLNLEGSMIDTDCIHVTLSHASTSGKQTIMVIICSVLLMASFLFLLYLGAVRYKFCCATQPKGKVKFDTPKQDSSKTNEDVTDSIT